MTLTRAKFEEICEPYWKRCEEKITEALTLARLNKANIAYTICVGGSTYIPKVRDLLRKYVVELHNGELVSDRAPDTSGRSLARTSMRTRQYLTVPLQRPR